MIQEQIQKLHDFIKTLAKYDKGIAWSLAAISAVALTMAFQSIMAAIIFFALSSCHYILLYILTMRVLNSFVYNRVDTQHSYSYYIAKKIVNFTLCLGVCAVFYLLLRNVNIEYLMHLQF